MLLVRDAASPVQAACAQPQDAATNHDAWGQRCLPQSLPHMRPSSAVVGGRQLRRGRAEMHVPAEKGRSPYMSAGSEQRGGLERGIEEPEGAHKKGPAQSGAGRAARGDECRGDEECASCAARGPRAEGKGREAPPPEQTKQNTLVGQEEGGEGMVQAVCMCTRPDRRGRSSSGGKKTVESGSADQGGREGMGDWQLSAEAAASVLLSTLAGLLRACGTAGNLCGCCCTVGLGGREARGGMCWRTVLLLMPACLRHIAAIQQGCEASFGCIVQRGRA